MTSNIVVFSRTPLTEGPDPLYLKLPRGTPCDDAVFALLNGVEDIVVTKVRNLLAQHAPSLATELTDVQYSELVGQAASFYLGWAASRVATRQRLRRGAK